MDYSDKLIGFGIFLVLVLVTFFMMIFSPKPKSYFDIDDDYPELNILKEDDVFAILHNDLIKNKQTCNDNIHIVYDGEKWYHDDKIKDVFSLIPNIKCVFVAELPAKTETPHRKGSAEYANHTLRCVIPLKLSISDSSGMWNDGESRIFKEQELVLYDDSRVNSFYNRHKKRSTFLLIVDVVRPVKYPAGISTHSHNSLF